MVIVFKSVLAFAFVYHGLWNLGEAGLQFWSQSEMLYPQWLRWPVGVSECLLALLLLHPRWERGASLFLMVLMIGAIFSNLKNGYSYKDLGVEVPIAYGVMLLAIFRRSFR